MVEKQQLEGHKEGRRGEGKGTSENYVQQLEERKDSRRGEGKGTFKNGLGGTEEEGVADGQTHSVGPAGVVH